jgi:hypothetical protein
MTEGEAKRIAAQVADLRMQINALVASTKHGNLPALLLQTRRTMLLTGLAISFALLASVVVRTWQDRNVSDLQDRVEDLEHKVQSLEPRR